MLAFSAAFAAACSDTALIFLQGSLGVGKTTFSRGFLRALGHSGPVKSPTYTLVESYEIDPTKANHPSPVTVFHFDFYRLKDAEELEFMGIRDYLVQGAICLIEWPEYGEGVLPAADLVCHFSFQGEGRMVKLLSHSPIGDAILQRFQYDQ